MTSRRRAVPQLQLQALEWFEPASLQPELLLGQQVWLQVQALAGQAERQARQESA